MDIIQFKETLGKIKLSKDMQNRIISNCTANKRLNMEGQKMKKTIMKKSILIAAAISAFICISIVGIAAGATGFFKDITRWDKAIVGTTYEQATEEVKVDIETDENDIIVSITMLSPDKPPYSEFEQLGIGNYKITDLSGKTIVDKESTESSQISEGQAEIKIPLNDFEGGDYRLIISKFVGSAKADQPLEIGGIWEEEFTI